MSQQCLLGRTKVGTFPGHPFVWTTTPVVPEWPNNWPLTQLATADLNAAGTFYVPVTAATRVVEAWFDVNATPSGAVQIDIGNETGAGEVQAFGTASLTGASTGKINVLGTNQVKLYAGATGNSIRVTVTTAATFSGTLNLRVVMT
jgi:hypothetical protein